MRLAEAFKGSTEQKESKLIKVLIYIRLEYVLIKKKNKKIFIHDILILLSF